MPRSPSSRPEQPTKAARAGSLKHKTATSILWTVVRTGSDYFFSFLVFAVLARTLGPRAFGVFALAAAFAELVRILPTAGFTSAIQRAKSVSPEMADTVLWASLAVASLGAAALALLAGPISHLVGEPAVAPLLVGLALTLPISAAGATHIALMLHDFGHKAMASRSVGSNLIGGAAGLAAAWGGWGAWSLVVQRGVTELVGTLMAWQAYPWSPALKFSTRLLRELSGYSLTMTYAQVLYVALVRVQDVIVGRFIDTAAVGQYRTAWRTVELISQGVIMPFTQVALPTLGRLQDDLPAFRKAYLRITAVCSAVAVPAIVGFAVVAPDVIPLVFGPEWAPAAPVAQVLGLMAVPVHPQPVCRARARHAGPLYHPGTLLHPSAGAHRRAEHRWPRPTDWSPSPGRTSPVFISCSRSRCGCSSATAGWLRRDPAVGRAGLCDLCPDGVGRRRTGRGAGDALRARHLYLVDRDPGGYVGLPGRPVAAGPALRGEQLRDLGDCRPPATCGVSDLSRAPLAADPAPCILTACHTRPRRSSVFRP